MIRQEIKKLIEKSINKLQKEDIFPKFEMPEIKVEHPEEKAHGDYSTNIALIIAKIVKKTPMEIAENLKSQIPSSHLWKRGERREQSSLRPSNTEPCDSKARGEKRIKSSSTIKSEFFEKIEVAKPGFINFFISKEYLQEQVKEILKQKEKFGELEIGKKQKVNVEFCSANPTGPLHLGHGRGAFWGDTLSNVLEAAGYKVTREYFINDYGKQILLLGKSIDASYMEILGQQAETREDFYKGEYVKEIADEIIEGSKDKYLKASENDRVKMFTEIGLKKMLKETKELLDKIGVKYDVWFSERRLYEKGLVKKAVESLKKKGFAYEKEGALWFSSTKFNDDKDRVLIKADNEPTYFASDVAYHLDKLSRKYDLMINGWGADHWGYKARLMAAAQVLGFEQKLKIVVGQFVRLVEKGKEVKMSKRGGTFITLKELVEEVGSDVSRFLFLMKSVDTHIDFDLSLAKEQSEKNPVYYVQYAHVRICSIIKKSKIQIKNQKLKLLKHSSELELIKQLIRLPEIIEDTARDYQVQRLPQYALDLATSFHQFYRDCRVLTETRSLLEARLALVSATKIVLKNTLDLMGISAPEKM